MVKMFTSKKFKIDLEEREKTQFNLKKIEIEIGEKRSCECVSMCHIFE